MSNVDVEGSVIPVVIAAVLFKVGEASAANPQRLESLPASGAEVNSQQKLIVLVTRDWAEPRDWHPSLLASSSTGQLRPMR
jgi:hypothetical protein